MPPTAAGETRAAVAAGLGCYLIWGFVPLAFQAIAREGAGPWEALAHRIVWASLAAPVFVLLARQGRQVIEVFTKPKTLALLALSAVLIAVNWVVFIGAVNNGHVIETSLGYFIIPLVNMAVGALVFREKLPRIGLLAIALAAIGVGLQAVAIGGVPAVALALAVSFGGYGIVRKIVAADAQTGLFVETVLLAVPSLAFVLWLEASGGGHFTNSAPAMLWLIAAGPITAVPLVLFAWAARRIPLSAMGFLQFIAPTISFAIGLIQGELFTPLRAVSFLFIWLGAAVFILGAWQASRMAKA